MLERHWTHGKWSCENRTTKGWVHSVVNDTALLRGAVLYAAVVGSTQLEFEHAADIHEGAFDPPRTELAVHRKCELVRGY